MAPALRRRARSPTFGTRGLRPCGATGASLKGAALVEAGGARFRCCAGPISIGIFEFGRRVSDLAGPDHAAREGARVAVLPMRPVSEREAARRDYMRGGAARALCHGDRRLEQRSSSFTVNGVPVSASAGHGCTTPFTFVALSAGRAIDHELDNVGANADHARGAMRNEYAVAACRHTRLVLPARIAAASCAHALTSGALTMMRVRDDSVLLVGPAGGGLAYGTYNYIQNVPAEAVSLPTTPVTWSLRPTSSLGPVRHRGSAHGPVAGHRPSRGRLRAARRRRRAAASSCRSSKTSRFCR